MMNKKLINAISLLKERLLEAHGRTSKTWKYISKWIELHSKTWAAN
jgi:hypothetical protein